MLAMVGFTTACWPLEMLNFLRHPSAASPNARPHPQTSRPLDPSAQSPWSTTVSDTPSESPSGLVTPVAADTESHIVAAAYTAEGIPRVALRAYRNAAELLGRSDPTCNLHWSLVAAIGRVESDHGRYGGTTVYRSGDTEPAILGLVLDGSGATARITDTDGGRLDGNTTFDRAVGPMQFLPGTWDLVGADGNGDGEADPSNLFDAALSAGRYLCAGDVDLSERSQLRNAVYSYNHSWSYVNLVLSIAADYRAGTPTTSLPPVPDGVRPPEPFEPPKDKELPPANSGNPLAVRHAYDDGPDRRTAAHPDSGGEQEKPQVRTLPEPRPEEGDDGTTRSKEPRGDDPGRTSTGRDDPEQRGTGSDDPEQRDSGETHTQDDDGTQQQNPDDGRQEEDPDTDGGSRKTNPDRNETDQRNSGETHTQDDDGTQQQNPDDGRQEEDPDTDGGSRKTNPDRNETDQRNSGETHTQDDDGTQQQNPDDGRQEEDPDTDGGSRETNPDRNETDQRNSGETDPQRDDDGTQQQNPEEPSDKPEEEQSPSPDGEQSPSPDEDAPDQEQSPSPDTSTSAPQVAGLAPDQGVSGGTVTITGSGLDDATVVFGDERAEVVSGTDEQLEVAVPPRAAAGTVNVSIRNPDGKTSAAEDFTYLPAITAIDPAAGSTAGGANMTITGTSLKGATASFGSEQAATVSSSGSELVVRVPAADQPGELAVTISSDSLASETAATFTYHPEITDAPESATPGAQIELQGSGFSDDSTVAFARRDEETQVTQVTERIERPKPGTLIVTVPEELRPGAYDLVVTTNGIFSPPVLLEIKAP